MSAHITINQSILKTTYTLNSAKNRNTWNFWDQKDTDQSVSVWKEALRMTERLHRIILINELYRYSERYSNIKHIM